MLIFIRYTRTAFKLVIHWMNIHNYAQMYKCIIIAHLSFVCVCVNVPNVIYYDSG